MKKIFPILLIGFFFVFSAVYAFALTFEGINYTVIEKSNWQNFKCRISIRFEQKVSKEFLQKLAVKLRQEETIKYTKILISYYLPGMIPGSGPWATSHFNPDLEVKILGTTIEEEKALVSNPNLEVKILGTTTEEEKALVSNPKNSSGEIIGEWLDDVGTKYTLLKNNGKILLIRKFKNGSSSEKEMIQKMQYERLRFEEIGGNNYGDYILIDNNGRLYVYDYTGLLSTMRSIK
ncbi:MAG: hypothetical protein NTU74_18790 [Deltaproteobacteria bacterium]|nr:hypothetical protein [Deltaproteobacteria bacterium]